MRAKQDVLEARQALRIRQIQQQAALERLRAQSRQEARAQEAMEARLQIHAAAQTGWTEILGRSTLDADAAGHWRAHTAGALTALRSQEEILRMERQRTAEQDEVWRRQVRLADAAQAVEKRSTVRLRRRLDDKGLAVAEDLFHATRLRS